MTAMPPSLLPLESRRRAPASVTVLLTALLAVIPFHLPGAPATNSAPPPPPPPPAALFHLPESVTNNLVLRRNQFRNERTTFTFTSVGMDGMDARTVPVRGRSGPDVRVNAVGESRADPVTWRVAFEEIAPREPFHLELRGRVRKPAKGTPREISIAVSNILVGEVWLWETAPGPSLPLTPEQRAVVIGTLQSEGVAVRVFDARRRPAAAGTSPSPTPRGWMEFSAEQLATDPAFPTFLPLFVSELTRAVRTDWYGQAGEKGRPLGIGLVLVDPATVPPGGSRGDPRIQKSPDVIKEVNTKVTAAHASYPGPSPTRIRELKRNGQLPPPKPGRILLEPEAIAGPFRGFSCEDASGMIRIQAGP